MLSIPQLLPRLLVIFVQNINQTSPLKPDNFQNPSIIKRLNAKKNQPMRKEIEHT